jgi:hypothetical protein
MTVNFQFTRPAEGRSPESMVPVLFGIVSIGIVDFRTGALRRPE